MGSANNTLLKCGYLLNKISNCLFSFLILFSTRISYIFGMQFFNFLRLFLFWAQYIFSNSGLLALQVNKLCFSCSPSFFILILRSTNIISFSSGLQFFKIDLSTTWVFWKDSLFRKWKSFSANYRISLTVSRYWSLRPRLILFKNMVDSRSLTAGSNMIYFYW